MKAGSIRIITFELDDKPTNNFQDAILHECKMSLHSFFKNLIHIIDT